MEFGEVREREGGKSEVRERERERESESGEGLK